MEKSTPVLEIKSASSAKRWSKAAYNILFDQSWVTRRVDRFMLQSATLAECKSSFDVDTAKINDILNPLLSQTSMEPSVNLPLMKRPKGIIFEVDCRDFEGRSISIASTDMSSWFAASAFLGAAEALNIKTDAISDRIIHEILSIIQESTPWIDGNMNCLKFGHAHSCQCDDCCFVSLLEDSDKLVKILKMLRHDSLILVPIPLSGKNEILKIRDIDWLHAGTPSGRTVTMLKNYLYVQVISNPTIGRHHVQFVAPEGGQIVSHEVVSHAKNSDGSMPQGPTVEVRSGFDQCATKFSTMSHFKKEDEFIILLRLLPKATLFYLPPAVAFVSSCVTLLLLFYYFFVQYGAINLGTSITGWSVNLNTLMEVRNEETRTDVINSLPFVIIFTSLISLIAVRTGEHAIISGQIIYLRILLITSAFFTLILSLTLTLSLDGRGIFWSMTLALVTALAGTFYCAWKMIEVLYRKGKVIRASGGRPHKKYIMFVPRDP